MKLPQHQPIGSFSAPQELMCILDFIPMSFKLRDQIGEKLNFYFRNPIERDLCYTSTSYGVFRI